MKMVGMVECRRAVRMTAQAAARATRMVALGAALVMAPPVLTLLHAQGGKPVGTVIEPFAVNDLDGAPFDFGSVLGKRPILVQFWATWCSVCEALMPTMRAAYDEFGDRVEFIGVNVTVNQTPARARRYVDEHRPPFRPLYDNRGVAVRAFEAPATGFVVIVDGDGKVAYTGIGERQDLVAVLRRVVR